MATEAWLLFTFSPSSASASSCASSSSKWTPSMLRAMPCCPNCARLNQNADASCRRKGTCSLRAYLASTSIGIPPSSTRTKRRAAFLAELPALARACASEFGKRTPEGWRDYLLDAHRTGKSRYLAIARNIEWDRRPAVESFPWITGRGQNGWASCSRRSPGATSPSVPWPTAPSDCTARKGKASASKRPSTTPFPAKPPNAGCGASTATRWIPASDDFVRAPEPGLDVRTTLDLRTQDVAFGRLARPRTGTKPSGAAPSFSKSPRATWSPSPT